MIEEDPVVVPDRFLLALVALVVGIGVVVAGFVLASGGRRWISVGVPLLAVFAVARSRIARTTAVAIPAETRLKLSDSARNLSVVSVLYAAGVLAWLYASRR